MDPITSNIIDNNCVGNEVNGIVVRGGTLDADTTWQKNKVPYVIISDLTVMYSEADTSTATLTVNPGVTIAFNKGTRLKIGYRYSSSSSPYFGAIHAQGTEDSPVTFTSAENTPALGDWYGIYFNEATDNNYSILEHCIIEYAAYGINLDDAKPKAIQYNTIRNNSHSGIYISGTDGVQINCNNLKDGIYATYKAQPIIHNNNLLRNSDYGIYNNSGDITIDAENNWWEDNENKVYGDVDLTPSLTSESTCIAAPPTNSQPFVAKSPDPADEAVRVAYESVTLTWSGGDPNPWDTVTYDVFFGTSPDNLAKIADNTETKEVRRDNLEPGKTYFWQVTARDNHGLEAAGDVWQFTTEGPPPDLIVTGIIYDPATGINENQKVTFTATVQNNGTGPVVDPFRVRFQIDGWSIGSKWISDMLYVGDSIQIETTWTARAGEHNIEVIADSSGTVAESDEENNTLSKTLPDITDTSAPENITNLRFQCFETKLILTWNHSANTSGNLVGYKLYFNDAADGIFLPLDQNSYEQTGLSPATAYSFKINAYDAEGNESSGVSQTGVTLLRNPANLSATPYSDHADLTWDGVEPAEYVNQYAVYMSETYFSSVEGMTPIREVTGTSAQIYSLTSGKTYFFAVTAINTSVGERKDVTTISVTCTTADLPPVSALTVYQKDDGSPLILWGHEGEPIAGYNIYIGSVKLNQELLTNSGYIDTGYAKDERRYTCVAVNEDGQESPGRSMTLPLLEFMPNTGEKILRGVMNRLEFLVENRSSDRIDHALLKVEIEGQVYTSQAFGINGETSQVIAVTVEGHGDLPDLVTLTSTIKITPDEGGKVEIIRTWEIEASDGMLVLGILNEEFVRGETGKVRFTLKNTGEAEIEIVTATDSGSEPSDEITVSLLDEDGNVLSTTAYKQTDGSDITTIGSRTNARIPAGSVFISESFGIDVPLTSPDNVNLELEISHVHYHPGQSDAVTLDGLSARQHLSLMDTSYYGEVLTVTPETSHGDETIEITGRAVERATDSSMLEVPLNLMISVNGFERTFQVFTDAQGEFHHTFVPLSNEYGS